MTSSPVLAWLGEPAPDRGIHFARTGHGWDFWSYERLAGFTSSLARRLGDLGVTTNDRISIVLPSGPEFVIAFFGSMLAGATPSPIAPAHAFQDISAYARYVLAILQTARPAVVLTERALLPLATECAATWPTSRVVSFDDLCVRPDVSCAWAAPRAADTAILQFTSGSSGRGRAVCVGFGALEHNISAIRKWLGWGSEEAFASWLPLHHDMGLVGALLCSTVAGSNLWLLRPEHFIRNPLRYLRCFGERGANLTVTAGFGIDHILRRVRPERLTGLDFTNWRGMVVGAERVDPNALDALHVLLRSFGFKRRALLPAYGLAEATLAVSGVPVGEEWIDLAVDPQSLSSGGEIRLARAADAANRIVGCGPPLEGVMIEIVDDEGRQVSEGRVGEIVVRGPSVALGYAGEDDSPSLTRFSNGALHTGDSGFMRDGQLFVLGRIGDSVKVRGRVIFGEDIEVAMSRIGVPRQHVAALLGVHHGVPTAVVVLESRNCQLSAVESVIRHHAEGTKIIVVKAPRGTIRWTTSGKPKRRELWQVFSRGALPGLSADHSDRQPV